MKFGHHHFNASEFSFWFNIDWDAATIVFHLGRAIRMQGDINRRAVPSQCLIYRVIHDLPEAVHKTATIVGADIHAWAFADGFETLENCEIFG
jgi:hypothetical protein